ncbi:cytochrome P450 [Spiractinospora alimapuensis]|uniref:cytochrome P450 family protein n=1 Tax=Spiractinospora alimapuensis TaxID=2820884 RepID=UPI001F433DFE|nr:cytochrome P450 [Spiractinospora alimapuensis]QVQ54407.1 cytochrome P450 [Spiractinospora alimapuensis]
MTTHSTVNLTDPELARSPARSHATIRESAPIARAEIPGVGQVWLVSRYEDVKAVLSDSRFVRNPDNVPGMKANNLTQAFRQHSGINEEFAVYTSSSLTQLDAPEHSRLRKLVSRAFTARRIAALRPSVERIAEDLLDALPSHAENGVVDLLAHFAYPLPVTVIGELIGVPHRDRAVWKERSGAVLTTISGGADPTVINEALGNLIDYAQDMIEQRRREPRDDLTSALVQAQEKDGDRLSTTEMVTLIFTLVFAGHETTATLIGNGTVALLSHPDQRAKLQRDPALLPRAVHEMLRWCGVITLGGRPGYATEDVELNGTVIQRGEAVMTSLVGANFDPRVFADPDAFDITRDTDGRPETHVAFMHGPHYCLGAALARQEGEVAFEALLRRYPRLALATDSRELELDANLAQFRYAAIPVTLH